MGKVASWTLPTGREPTQATRTTLRALPHARGNDTCLPATPGSFQLCATARIAVLSETAASTG